MRIDKRFSIVIPVHEEYELLRQAFESILHHVDPLSYKDIIIVDDYSNPNGLLRRYEDYLEVTYPFVKLIHYDEYRYCTHNVGKDFSCIGLESDKVIKGNGHGFSLWNGILVSSGEFVLCFDADCIFLKKSFDVLHKLSDLFDQYPLTMSIGQLAGLMTNEIIELDKFFPFSYGERGHPNILGGTPGSPAFACRRCGWTIYEIEPIASQPKLSPWVGRDYCTSLLNRKFRLLNFPILSDGYVFHAGGGILRNARLGRRASNAPFGMCAGTRKTYGPRTTDDILYDWYAGRLLLKLTSDEYEKYLKGKYKTPFDKLQDPLDENLLFVPIEEKPIRMTREECVKVWGEELVKGYVTTCGRIK